MRKIKLLFFVLKYVGFDIAEGNFTVAIQLVVGSETVVCD